MTEMQFNILNYHPPFPVWVMPKILGDAPKPEILFILSSVTMQLLMVGLKWNPFTYMHTVCLCETNFNLQPFL